MAIEPISPKTIADLSAAFTRLTAAMSEVRRAMATVAVNQFSTTENIWCSRCKNYRASKSGGLCPVCLDDDKCRSLEQTQKKVTDEQH